MVCLFVCVESRWGGIVGWWVSRRCDGLLTVSLLKTDSIVWKDLADEDIRAAVSSYKASPPPVLGSSCAEVVARYLDTLSLFVYYRPVYFEF